MKTPLTIIVPTYNVARFLKQCLTAIQKQTFLNFECLIVDDGSTDKSIMISEQFCQQDNRFQLIKCEHHSLAHVQNVGLQHAHGEYVTFCDGDDFVSNNGYSKVMQIAQEQHPDLIVSNFCRYYNNAKHSRTNMMVPTVMKGNDLIQSFPELYQQNFMFYDWNKIYRYELIKEMRFRDLTVGLDTIFNYELFAKKPTVIFNNEQYYFYRQRLGSLVNHYDPHRLNIRKQETNALATLLQGWQAEYQDKLLTYDWFATLSLCIKNLYLPDSPLVAAQRLQTIKHLLAECLPHINNAYLTNDELHDINLWQNLNDDQVLIKKWQKINAKYFTPTSDKND